MGLPLPPHLPCPLCHAFHIPTTVPGLGVALACLFPISPPEPSGQLAGWSLLLCLVYILEPSAYLGSDWMVDIVAYHPSHHPSSLPACVVLCPSCACVVQDSTSVPAPDLTPAAWPPNTHLLPSPPVVRLCHHLQRPCSLCLLPPSGGSALPTYLPRYGAGTALCPCLPLPSHTTQPATLTIYTPHLVPLFPLLEVVEAPWPPCPALLPYAMPCHLPPCLPIAIILGGRRKETAYYLPMPACPFCILQSLTHPSPSCPLPSGDILLPLFPCDICICHVAGAHDRCLQTYYMA